MIIGIGTDIIEIERVQRGMDRSESFGKKIFSKEEQSALEQGGYRKESIAGRFAAKEAISKALGTGFRRFGPSDITILNDEMGKPIVTLQGGAKIVFEEIGGSAIHLSISHCKDYAVAYAMIEGREAHEVSYERANESH